MTLSASVLMLAGCSQGFNTSSSSRAETVSMRSASPEASFQQARQLAWEAAVLVQNPPHPADQWQEARIKWRQAIRLLEAIPPNAAIAQDVQRKLADYRSKYAAINQRLKAEQQATENFAQAQTMAWQAAVTVQNPPHPVQTWQRAADRWAQATQLLSEIPPYTTVSAPARTKLVTYRQNQALITEQLETERKFSSVLEAFSLTVNRLNKLQVKALMQQTEDPIGIDYESYETVVRSLQNLVQPLDRSPTAQTNPAYTEMKRAIADYEFALSLWRSYLRHKEANADWLQNGDFFNRLVPLTPTEQAQLGQYDVEIYRGLSTAKVPLKSAVWAIWEKADEHAKAAQQKPTSLQ